LFSKTSAIPTGFETTNINPRRSPVSGSRRVPRELYRTTPGTLFVAERGFVAVNRPTVVFDTRVLVAELAFPDEPLACVALADSDAVEVAISPALLREFAAVLGYDRLPLAGDSPACRTDAVERVLDVARVVEPAVQIDAAADPDDDAVLECAVAAAADLVVSDDSHLRDRDGFAGVAVHTREGFLDRRAEPR
jgi:putative PIN family toxin of toxin-antitoxin system